MRLSLQSLPLIGGVVSAKARIAQKAIELLAQEPGGLRHSELLRRLKDALPEIPPNTIRGGVVGLSEYKPAEVYRPAKGLFQHAKFRGDDARDDGSGGAASVRESDFYAAFAGYLVENLEECTKCVPLGGSLFATVACSGPITIEALERWRNTPSTLPRSLYTFSHNRKV